MVAENRCASSPPSGLLFNFWRELFAFDGPLDIPARRLCAILPWSMRFAAAAFRRNAHTLHLAQLVKPAAGALQEWLREIGRTDLLRRNGHYEISLNGNAGDQAVAQADAMHRLRVRVEPAPTQLLRAAKAAARARCVAGLWFPDSAHVTDPLEIVCAFVTAAAAAVRGATFRRAEVYGFRPRGHAIEVLTDTTTTIANSATPRPPDYLPAIGRAPGQEFFTQAATSISASPSPRSRHN